MKFKRIVEQLYRFYTYCGVRMSGLREIQAVLNEPQLKIREAKDVRWLSHDRAVTSIRKCLPAILTSLDREASERADVQAQGLLAFMRTSEFVATLYMMSDVLPELSSLSRSFQSKDGAYAIVGTLVTGTVATVRSLKDSPREHYSKLAAVITDLLTQPFRFHEPIETQKKNFERNFLSDHFSQVVDQDQVQTEYRLLKNTASGSESMQEKATHRILEEVAGPLADTLPNLAKLASIGLLIPTSTADCERGFSTLSRVKTKLRNRLSNPVTNSLLRISMEGPAVDRFNYSVAVDSWAAEKKRRLKVV